MNLKQILVQILDNYPSHKEQKYKPFNRNTVSNIPLKKSDRSMIKDAIGSNILGDLCVDCSCGIGKWASCPMITIYDPKQYYPKRASATRGKYLVYLFSDDLKYVYLSLNMGATQFAQMYSKSGSVTHRVLDIIKGHAETLRTGIQALININSLNIDTYLINHPILLKRIKDDRSSLLLGYENGNIYSLKYSANEIRRANNIDLLNDLSQMIIIYQRLMNQSEGNLLAKEDSERINNKLNLNKYNISHMQLRVKPANKLKLHKQNNIQQSNHMHNNIKKLNHAKKRNKKNAYLGENGELAVIHYEKRRLINGGRPDLAKKVYHESAYGKRRGNNRAGYDVKSYNLDGSNLYIEVKTTISNSRHKSFPISANELRFASSFDGHDKNHMSKDYRLYRIYKGKVNKKNKLPVISYTARDLLKAYNAKSYQIVSYMLFI